MYPTNPIEALRRQLDTLGETAKKGFVRLNTPCQVDSLMGWLSVQRVLPRIYWRARDEGAVEYAVLGVINVFGSLASLQADLAALGDIGGEQPDFFWRHGFRPWHARVGSLSRLPLCAAAYRA